MITSTKNSSTALTEQLGELEKFDTYDASILEAFMKLQLLIDSFIELDSTSIVQANFGKIKVILVNFEQISQQIKRPMTFQNSERQSSYKSFDFLYAKVRYILTQIGRIFNMYDTIQTRQSMASYSE